MMLRKKDWI